MTASAGNVEARLEDGTGWIILSNERRRNAMSRAMWMGLEAAIESLGKDDRVRSIVLRGAGTEAFVSGADITELQSADSDAARRELGDAVTSALLAIEGIAKPTIAMIHGYCFGGGVAIAAACDMRLAAASAKFSIPAARLGIGYDIADIRRLVALVGVAQAKRMLFLAERLDAVRAREIGLVEMVLPSDELEKETWATARLLGDNAPLTIRAAKMAIDLVAGPYSDERCAEVVSAIGDCLTSEDYAEGKRAFMERRDPRFLGR